MTSNPLITRNINCLQSEDKFTRKKALSSLHDQLKGGIPEDVLAQILRPILSLISDPSDSIRELSLTLLAENVDLISTNTLYVQEVMSSIYKQLPEEKSEEIRLQMARLHHSLPTHSPSVNIIIALLGDPFHSVRHVACDTINKITDMCPQLIYAESQPMLQALVPSLTHNHSKLRKTALLTMGTMILKSKGDLVKEAVPHLAQRFFDHNHSVRESATTVVGTWLIDLPDRYSYFANLIPLMLTSGSDEREKIAELGSHYWHDVGMKFLGENEEDLKDKINFLHIPDQICSIGDHQYRRPNLGCCELVQRNIGKILPPLKSDLSDWLSQTRIKAAQLLPQLLLNAGDQITQHVEMLVIIVIKMGSDEEEVVVSKARESSQMIGYFVDPGLWLDLVLSHLSKNSSSASLLQSTLLVVTEILRASTAESMAPLSAKVFECLGANEISQSQQKSVQLALVGLLDALVTLLGDRVDVFEVVKHSLYVSALAGDHNVGLRVGDLWLKVTLAEKLAAVSDLVDKYSPLLIASLDCGCGWTEESPSGRFFEAVLTESCSVGSWRLGLPYFEANLRVERDPGLKLRLFNLISRLFSRLFENDCDELSVEDFQRVLENLIIPNVVWKAGRSASAVRTATLACLWVLLSQETVFDKITGKISQKICSDLLSLMISCLDDASPTSRLFSVRICGKLLSLFGSGDSCEREIMKFCENLLKRLDDSEDSIRLEAIRTFYSVFACFRGFSVGESRRSHFEFVYRTLLLHMDDPDGRIQEGVCELLMAVGDVFGGVLREELGKVARRHRVAGYCEKLAGRLDQLLI